MKGFNFINIKIKDLILHKASQNFIIIAAVAGFQIITNVIVGRELSKDDFGKYSFVFLNVINVLSVLFLFGQPAPILRLLSMNKIEELKWKKVILLFLLTISIPLLIASYIVACYYNLGNMWFIVISVGSFFMCCTLVIGTIIRAQGNFNKAVLIERANPVLFMILLSIVYLTSDVDLFIVSVLKIISMFFGFCYLLYIIVSWKEGKNKISKNIISEGLVLWEMGLTVLVMTNIDSFFIVKILSYEDMALYSIIGLIMQIFTFARESIFSVYSQKYANSKNIDSAQIFKFILVFSIFISFAYIIGTNYILTLLFKGKYYASILLILLFCIYHSINLLYVIPSCYFVGQSSKKEIRIMTGINLTSLILKLSFILLFANLGLIGFLLAGILSLGFRTAGGYYITFRGSKKHV